jgi:hypothetical protein
MTRALFLTLPLALLAACGATVGDACTTNRECGAGLCLNRDFTPGGACSIGCTLGAANACPAGTLCLPDVLGKDLPGCMRTCKGQVDCRVGYVCTVERDSAQPVCVGPAGI